MITEQRRRVVSFNNDVAIIEEIPFISSMSYDELCNRWYQPSDLNDFKSEARTIWRKLRILHNKTAAHRRGTVQSSSIANYDNNIPILVETSDDEESTSSVCSSDSELSLLSSSSSLHPQQKQQQSPPSNATANTTTARGLEYQIFFERSNNKHIVTRTILKAQNKYKSSHQLSIIAERCTQWARSVALSTGFKDFYTAYYPSLLKIVPDIPIEPFPLKNSRVVRSSKRRNSRYSSGGRSRITTTLRKTNSDTSLVSASSRPTTLLPNLSEEDRPRIRKYASLDSVLPSSSSCSRNVRQRRLSVSFEAEDTEEYFENNPLAIW